MRESRSNFALVTALAVDRKDMAREYRRFNYAHMQHHTVFDVLINRQGALTNTGNFYYSMASYGSPT